jgi:hypothetical protein
MRFPVFSHDSNPRIDTPIRRKSQAYVLQLIADGFAFPILDDDGKFVGAHCLPPGQVTQKTASVDELLSSSDAHGPITGAEAVHNATGVADRLKRRLVAAEMRAMTKVKHYGPPGWSYRGKKDGYGLVTA